MESNHLLPFLLRFLPSIALIALGFVAVSDKNTRERWANLLYQAGSVRPEQRDDPKVQSGVKWPFFILALIMLFLPAKLGPFSYYSWATNKPPVVSDLRDREREGSDEARVEAPSAEPTATVGPPPVLNPPMPGAPGGAPAGGSSAPSRRNDTSSAAGTGGLAGRR